MKKSDDLPDGKVIRPADWKALIGKKVRFAKSTSSLVMSGVVENVSGRNVLISGNWFWIPHTDYIDSVATENNP